MNETSYRSLLATVDWLRACFSGDQDAAEEVRRTVSPDDLITGLTSACMGCLVGSSGDPQEALKLLHAVLSLTPDDSLPYGLSIDPQTAMIRQVVAGG